MTDELLKQADRDVVHLNWIYNRLELRYNNDRNMDYMQALRRCISNYKALADELRASNETINRQHEMAQKQEKTIKTLSNELRQLESVVSEHNSFLKFTYKQVERGMFSEHMTAETALSNIAHQPESPFKNPKWNWDVSHCDYADAFYSKFPKEKKDA